MCDFILTPLMALSGAGAATAAGATATAATAGAAAAGAGIGGTLQTLGTILGIGGSLAQGIIGAQTAQAEADMIGAQRETERELALTRESRTRAQFRSQIARQTAELAQAGVLLSSPTALALAQDAGREMSFEAQAIRSGAQATDIELSGAQRNARARRTQSLLRGTVSAAGDFLSAAPDLWPELLK